MQKVSHFHGPSEEEHAAKSKDMVIWNLWGGERTAVL